MKEGHDMTPEETDEEFNRIMTIELLAAQPWWKAPMRCRVCGRPFDLVGDWVGDRRNGYLTAITCPDCVTPEDFERRGNSTRHMNTSRSRPANYGRSRAINGISRPRAVTGAWNGAHTASPATPLALCRYRPFG